MYYGLCICQACSMLHAPGSFVAKCLRNLKVKNDASLIIIVTSCCCEKYNKMKCFHGVNEIAVWHFNWQRTHTHNLFWGFMVLVY